MSEVFDLSKPDWTFKARVPAVLRTTQLPLPPAAAEVACLSQPRRSAAWWNAAMAGQDFSQEDQLNTTAYNHALWRGLKGDGVAYPDRRDGRDLRLNRDAILKAAGMASCP